MFAGNLGPGMKGISPTVLSALTTAAGAITHWLSATFGWIDNAGGGDDGGDGDDCFTSKLFPDRI